MRSIITVAILLFSIECSGQVTDSCAFYKRQNDTLKHNLYMTNKKLTKILFYDNLVIKKPSQLKFLKSWVNRAMK